MVCAPLLSMCGNWLCEGFGGWLCVVGLGGVVFFIAISPKFISMCFVVCLASFSSLLLHRLFASFCSIIQNL